MKDIDISPVLDENHPARMGDGTHKERVEQEDRINEYLDVSEVLGESEPVNVDLET